MAVSLLGALAWLRRSGCRSPCTAALPLFCLLLQCFFFSFQLAPRGGLEVSASCVLAAVLLDIPSNAWGRGHALPDQGRDRLLPRQCFLGRRRACHPVCGLLGRTVGWLEAGAVWAPVMGRGQGWAGDDKKVAGNPPGTFWYRPQDLCLAPEAAQSLLGP